MRWFILTDIHGNVDALDAVLAVVPRDAYDRLLVLGDLVGYGASPNEVVDRIHALRPDVLIRGNHDQVASGVESPDRFNQLAAEAAQWTLETLTVENRERVAGLPAGPQIVDAQVEVCHGTPSTRTCMCSTSLMPCARWRPLSDRFASSATRTCRWPSNCAGKPLRR